MESKEDPADYFVPSYKLSKSVFKEPEDFLKKYYMPGEKTRKSELPDPWSARQYACFRKHDDGAANLPYSHLKCFGAPKHHDLDESFMAYRRFAQMHLKLLQDRLHARIEEQERLIVAIDQDEKDLAFRKESVPLEDDESARSGLRLLQKTMDKLSHYDETILNMRSLSQIPLSSVPGFRSIREYLHWGPPIYMDHIEIGDHRWVQYERDVDKILKDPKAGQWLDSPLNALLQNNDARRQDDPYRQSWLQRVWDQTAISGGILFWILHITSALGSILIDQASTHDDDSFGTLVLAYWYLSAIIILVQGLFAKGLVYARKVFVGGILACLGGLYVLRAWMRISQAASLAAMPAFFTIAMLLIRTL